MVATSISHLRNHGKPLFVDTYGEIIHGFGTVPRRFSQPSTAPSRFPRCGAAALCAAPGRVRGSARPPRLRRLERRHGWSPEAPGKNAANWASTNIWTHHSRKKHASTRQMDPSFKLKTCASSAPWSILGGPPHHSPVPKPALARPRASVAASACDQ